MFSAIGGKKYQYQCQQHCEQNELENIVTSDIGRNPKLHIPDAKLFLVQHLNYWMYEYK